MNKILVILGPTATGKTDLALTLAKKFKGELVACDSRQVYKDLDIGTGKMPGRDLRFTKYDLRWETDGINIWMYDVVDPKIRFTIKDYVERANQVIEGVIKRGKLPIIVGGTGLYLKALLKGFSNLSIPVDEKLREELEQLSLESLQQKLVNLSPTRWENLNQSDRQNPRRLLRSIELILMNPYKKTEKLKGLNQKHQILKIGLTAPQGVLNNRIDLRILSWLQQGLIQEGEKLLKEGVSLKRMKDLGLEYKILADYLENKISENELLEQLKHKNHQYAKRQMTWFKKEENTRWFDIQDENLSTQVEKLVSLWYHAPNDKTD